MKCLAIIPARGGSKGIPGKNIIDFHGKPLIAWTIEEALKVKGVTALVSTDDPAIAAVARAFGALVPGLRPAILAEDATPTLPVLHHHMRELASQGQSFDVVATLQPTSPLRRAWHLEQALSLLAADTTADTLVSVRDVPHAMAPVCLMSYEGKQLVPDNSQGPVSRHGMKHHYARNAAMYLARWDWLNSWTGPGVIGGQILGQMMDPITSIDIDEPIDLEMARAYLAYFRFDNGRWVPKN